MRASTAERPTGRHVPAVGWLGGTRAPAPPSPLRSDRDGGAPHEAWPQAPQRVAAYRGEVSVSACSQHILLTIAVCIVNSIMRMPNLLPHSVKAQLRESSLRAASAMAAPARRGWPRQGARRRAGSPAPRAGIEEPGPLASGHERVHAASRLTPRCPTRSPTFAVWREDDRHRRDQQHAWRGPAGTRQGPRATSMRAPAPQAISEAVWP